MKRHPFPLAKVGILGAGQLARMMIYRSKKLGFHFSVLDPDPEAGAVAIADRSIVGGLYDADKIRELVRSCDVTTYDIEHVGTSVLKELEAEGHAIYPSPKLLEIVQDKVLQKQLYQRAGLPVTDFVFKEVRDLEENDFPVVQKRRTGGYDGKGVQVLRSPADVSKAFEGNTAKLEESFLERFVAFERELGVMVVRGRKGEVEVYPVVDMVFRPDLNICDEIRVPANVSPEIERRAREMAVRAVEALDGVGAFGVELFLTADGRLFLNEIAPRPHNSGHYTMEGCRVCQFENHVRAVTGLPLAPADLISASVMVNLLGEGTGATELEGLGEALSTPGFSLHLYGKTECRPGRKMGHFTVVGPSIETALERARSVSQYLKVTGAKRG